MLPDIHKILFFIFALLAGSYGVWGFYRLYLRVRRGAPSNEARFDRLGQRIAYAVRTSLTQERTFRRRTVISVLHSFIFYGFVFYLLVNVIDGLEGYFHFSILSSNPLGAVYNLLADILSFLVLFGVVSLVVRRLYTPSKRDFRFTEKTLLHPLLKQNYILRDSLFVSAFIFFHVGSRILGNSAKMVVEAREYGRFDGFQPVSSALGRVLFGGASDAALEGWRIFGYWGALGSVLAFLAYFPYTKHIHIFMAPLNYALKREAKSGVLPPMKGLEAAMEADEPRLGAEKLEDLEWPRLLDAYACIQCNRCQDVCPANATGKALSPAALEINKRMELNVLTGGPRVQSQSGQSQSSVLAGGPTTLGLAAQGLAAPAGAPHPSPFTLRPTSFESGASTAHPLLEFTINEESVWACTTCGACMQVCPVQDEQMLDIIDIRRHQVMVAGEFPPQLQTAFRGMERTSNPWGISRDKRMEWAEGLKVPTIDENPEPDVIYWVGCAASYDPGAQKVARSFVQLLDKAGINYAVLGKKEACTGDSARRAGNEFLYQTLAQENVETLNSVRPKLIVATCPHCMNAIGHEYKQLGGDYSTVHHTEYLETLVAAGKLPLAQLDQNVTYHDPCYLGRHNGVYDAPRSLISQMAGEVLELERSRDNSFCCGAGGAQFWKEEEEGRERISDNRFREIQARLDGAKDNVQAGKVLAVGCPFCKSMMNSTPEKQKRDDIVVKDVAELMFESVQKAGGFAPTAAPAVSEPVPVPNAELPMERTGEMPAADAPAAVVGETAADVANAQPGSPTANAGTQPEAQAAHPEAVRPEAVPSESVQPEQSQAQPSARKAWKPKSGQDAATPADDVNPAPVVAEALSPSEPAPAAPTRKAWKPKGGDAKSSDDVSPAPVAEAVQTQAAAPIQVATEPTPARKAWKPKAAAPASDSQGVESVAEVVTPLEVAPVETAEASPTGERKKWTPKGAAPAVAPAEAAPVPAQTESVQPLQAESSPVLSTETATPERKKWTPKAAAAPIAPNVEAVAQAQSKPVQAEAAASAPAPAEAVEHLAPITEHIKLEQVGENALEEGAQATSAPAEAGQSAPETGARKKWVPKKKE
ncbi:heterodisulfide reductase-related iron-sulfur binding cluster [Deinococcus sp. QL22]|uniref:heterodisulfide reductase-related iron-sulfur binding cluster n=1 Tax=Deinococcus sp. QL22 TaxID=2939437 RepID=UPI0020174DF1|nr:heterodisulfide reductase-related iron-sulfur binding cluster [Deinococcus sp. QL22]UQN05890.1 heterodisulfide reductase-related iron-sulfur binding cluster [Deinococcus sp. QL22]